MPGVTSAQKEFLNKMVAELDQVSTAAAQMSVFVQSVNDYDDGFFTHGIIKIRKTVNNLVNTLAFEDGRTLMQYYLDKLAKELDSYGDLVSKKE